jgi:cleavage stimulation factor subunit 2
MQSDVRQMRDPREAPPPPQQQQPSFAGRDPRSRDPRDRGAAPAFGGPSFGAESSMAAQLPPHLAGADPEKAELILRVMKLTDEQIEVLPFEQRQSILELKRQINAVPH